jgi:hypothetical protein
LSLVFPAAKSGKHLFCVTITAGSAFNSAKKKKKKKKKKQTKKKTKKKKKPNVKVCT